MRDVKANWIPPSRPWAGQKHPDPVFRRRPAPHRSPCSAGRRAAAAAWAVAVVGGADGGDDRRG
jgi:hypothetical protein